MKDEELTQIQEQINIIEQRLLKIYKSETDLLSFVSTEYEKWSVIFLGNNILDRRNCLYRRIKA